MAFQLLSASAATALLIVVSIFVARHLRTRPTLQEAKKPIDQDLTSNSLEPTIISKILAAALLDSVA